MADYTVSVDITAKDKASKPFGKVSDALEDVEKDFKTTQKAAAEAGKGFGKVGTSAIDFAAKINIAQQAFGLLTGALGKVGEFAKLGATAERVERRFGKFSEAAGGATAIMEAFQTGAGGAASKMDAMASSSQLLQMGLVTSASGMEEIVEIATRLGDQTAGVTNRVSDFALMLANQSIPRLDNFGISSGKVRARIAELQATTKDMTREAAFMQAVMEEGGKSLDILGDRVEDDAMQFEIMDAKMADLKVTLGQAIVPLFIELTSVTIAAVDALAPWIEKLGVAVGLLADFGGETEEVSQRLLGVSSDMLSAETIARQFADAMLGVDTEFKATADTASGMAKDLLKVSKNTELLRDAQDGLQQSAIDLTNNYGDYAAIIDKFNSLMPDASLHVDAFTRNQWLMNLSLGKLVADAESADKAMLVYASRLRDTGKATTDLATEQRREELALLRLTKLTDDSTAATDEWVNGVNVAADAARESKLERHDLTLETQAEERAALAAAAAEDVRASRIEHLTAMQVAGSQQRAAALELERSAAIRTAEAEAQLAGSLVDASEKQKASALISGLDADAMGAIAYSRAVEEIQLAFGLATPESIALSRALTEGAMLANEGAIAYSDLDDFIVAVSEDAKDGQVSIEDLTHRFRSSKVATESLAQTLDATGENLGGLTGRTEDLVRAEDGLETSTKTLKDNMADYSAVTFDGIKQQRIWTDSLTGTTHVLGGYHTSVANLNKKLAETGEESVSTEDGFAALNAVYARGITAFVQPYAEATEKLQEKLGLMGEDTMPTAEEGVLNIGTAADEVQEPLGNLSETVGNTQTAFEEAKIGVDNYIVSLGTIPSEVKTTVVTEYSETGNSGSSGSSGPPGGGRRQHGGILPGPAWQAIDFIGHGTERIVPVGMMVGPTGPPVAGNTNNNNYGGNSYTNIINNERAAALIMHQQRMERNRRIEARV